MFISDKKHIEDVKKNPRFSIGCYLFGHNYIEWVLLCSYRVRDFCVSCGEKKPTADTIWKNQYREWVENVKKVNQPSFASVVCWFFGHKFYDHKPKLYEFYAMDGRFTRDCCLRCGFIEGKEERVREISETAKRDVGI